MVDKNAVRGSYDELADIHASQRTDDDQGMEILTQFLDSISESDSVLDAGCGQGTPVLSQISTSTNAVGVDFSRGQLKLAVDNAPDAFLAQGDMTTLPFATSTFDAIVAYWSLIHVPMDDHQTVIDEFSRVLQPGGRVLLCEGTNEWIGENPDWLDSGIKMEWNIAGAETTRAQLLNTGFTIDNEWGALSSLEADRKNETDDGSPWTFFSARLTT
ncbi:class I SAM-dependent methyltransferase [Haladaptatus caseinilyticus]|uniref:class I SAM-dependent methyltransferase n=1 Tax=Haladaptatus caseinilyticus TaxID=2993314 RepID=UPI00224A5BE3|nr:class I SAM-dependent methyltransferase [Haladaptatus caseinilyticus]